MTRFASGAEAETYWLTTACTAGSAFEGSGCADDARARRVQGVADEDVVALAPTSLPFLSSMVSVMSLRTRPNDEALVIRRVTPLVVMVQRYSACVCADTITLIDGSRRAAIAAMSLPARLPAQPLSVAARRLEAALVDDEDRDLHALVGELGDGLSNTVP